MKFLLGLALVGAIISVQAQDSLRYLDEITVSGNRIQAGFDQFSANVLIIGSKEISESPALSVADLLHYYGGVDIRQRGANGIQADAGIRGSTFDQVLILINGVKISDAQTGHHSLNLPIDIENVERIEVLKGPAARIYGQNAFAGAINIITKTPNETFLKFKAIGGEDGLGGVGLSGALANEKGRHYFSATNDFSDGYKYNTAYTISNYFMQSEWKVKNKTISLFGGFTDREFGANGFYASPAFQDQFETVKTSLIALTMGTRPSEKFSLNHRLYWRRNQDEYVFNKNNPLAYRNLHTGNTMGFESNGVLKNSIGALGLGLDVSYLDLKSNNLGDRNRTVVTLFVEHRFELGKFDITPGAQFNYYSDFGANFFPGVDVGYKVGNHFKMFANAGYTYRVPTYTDLYYSDPANLGNADLKPEKAFSYEIGLKIIDNPRWQGQVSYFNRDGREIIDWTKSVPTDPWQPDNVAKLNMNGLDFQLSVLPFGNDWLRINSNFTYIDADKGGDAVISRYAFENLLYQVTESFTWKYVPQLFHSVNFRYNDRANMPDYYVFDTRLNWVGKKANVFLDVTNVLDETYKETNLVTMPGRWIKLGFSYKFKYQN